MTFPQRSMRLGWSPRLRARDFVSSSWPRLQMTRTPCPLRSKRKASTLLALGILPRKVGSGKLGQQGAHDQQQFLGLRRDVVAVVADGERQGKVDAGGAAGEGVDHALGEVADLHFAAVAVVDQLQAERQIVPLVAADVLDVQGQLRGKDVGRNGERHRRRQVAGQVVPGGPGHRQVGFDHDLGEFGVKQIVDLSHSGLLEEIGGVLVGAELPAVEMIGMAGDEIGQFRRQASGGRRRRLVQSLPPIFLAISGGTPVRQAVSVMPFFWRSSSSESKSGGIDLLDVAAGTPDRKLHATGGHDRQEIGQLRPAVEREIGGDHAESRIGLAMGHHRRRAGRIEFPGCPTKWPRLVMSSAASYQPGGNSGKGRSNCFSPGPRSMRAGDVERAAVLIDEGLAGVGDGKLRGQIVGEAVVDHHRKLDGIAAAEDVAGTIGAEAELGHL